jgi:hypothetical protein
MDTFPTPTESDARAFISRFGTVRSILLHLLLIGAFGIWIPKIKGIDFLDSEILAAYACLGLIFSAPAAAQPFISRPSFSQATTRIYLAVLYGELVAMVLLGTGIATVYATHRGGFVPTPDWITLAKSAAFGLGGSLGLSSLAAWLTIRFSKTVAMIAMRLLFFGLLVLFFFKGRWLPDVGLEGAAVGFAIAALFIMLLRKELK